MKLGVNLVLVIEHAVELCVRCPNLLSEPDFLLLKRRIGRIRIRRCSFDDQDRLLVKFDERLLPYEIVLGPEIYLF